MEIAQVISLIIKYGPTAAALLQKYGPKAEAVIKAVAAEFRNTGAHDAEGAMHAAFNLAAKKPSLWTTQETKLWNDKATGAS